MLLASEVHSGMILKDGDLLFQVIESEHHKGTAKMSGFIHMKLKNLKTGTFTERRYKPEDKMEDVELEQQTLEFLYDSDNTYYFMNPQNYEQYPIPKEKLGKVVNYPLSKIKISVGFFEGKPLQVLVPHAIELQVTTTVAPGHHEQDNTFKSATLENGMEVLVPQFVKQGEMVKIDIETGKYLDRVKTMKK
jgi:elongation factor P